MRALTSAAAAALGLIALQAVVSRGGSGRISELFKGVSRVVERALDPTIPALPDRRAAAASVSTSSTGLVSPLLPVRVSA